jgi:ATP-dependent Lhr-like helicase
MPTDPPKRRRSDRPTGKARRRKAGAPAPRLTRGRGGRQRVTTRAAPAPPPEPLPGVPSGLLEALPPGEALRRLRGFFLSRGWTPHAFQEEAWGAYAAGESGLIHVPTGSGKTYAAYLAALADVAEGGEEGLQVLYVTPLRAVSRDVELALQAPLPHLGAAVRVESRTGDTPAPLRARQRLALPHVLVTTPESLSVMLSGEEAPLLFSRLRSVVVDEWHELLGTKRGTQVELALARLRAFAPRLRTWGMSATLANLPEAARALVGAGRPARVVSAPVDRPVDLDTLLPARVDAFPWAGHLGFTMLERVAGWLDPSRPTLVFTNTRSQAERWYQGLLFARPGWGKGMALHHGSLDREERERVEAGLKSGRLWLAVCTSSLDLGVDFGPVQRVVQVGSPKGVGRTLQRAGRSAHRPGERCQLLFVPTHALELVEMAAAREAVARGEVEGRAPLAKPLDVLSQHLVTCALGGGFTREALLAEVRTCTAYAGLTDEEFDWALALVRHGGKALSAYADYHRVVEVEGVFRVATARLARLHRMSIGTITSEASVQLKFVQGQKLGSVEEGFIARLRPGDRFLFAGRALEFVHLKEMTALVRPARGEPSQTPRWSGSRMPFSTSLASAVRRTLGRVREGRLEGPELEAARPVLEAQARLSRVPGERTLLAEECHTREGHHLFLYPFEGRLVHEGLAALLALRMTRHRRATFSLSVNDYGLELLAAGDFPFSEALSPALFTTERLVEDVLESVNVSELARRQFRDVARVAGLINPGAPSVRKSQRQVQASASLLFDVFTRYDPDNLLLQQARREVLEQHFEQNRLLAALGRLAALPLEHVRTRRPSPLAFPLVVERVSAHLSNESLLERVERMRRGYARDEEAEAGEEEAGEEEGGGAAGGGAPLTSG